MNTIIIGFSGNTVRILQLGETKQIVSKDEITLSFNVNDESCQKKGKSELVNEFIDSVNNILINSEQELLNASIIIETAQTFLSVFPVDFNEDQSNINSHILWELSNYFPETYKDFNVKYFRLNNNYLNENIDEVLLIAIEKIKIDFIRNLCNACNIKIRNMEIDQFAVEKCLREIYPDLLKNKCILIIGCRNSRLDFSLIKNEKLKYYDYENFEGDNYKNSLIKEINLFSSSSGRQKIDKIFLYGDDITFKIKNFITEQFENTECDFITASDTEDSRFSPLYGLALKTYDSGIIR